MSVDKLIAEYESRLSKLRNWPDKAVIFELSSFALRNIHIANHIADILISRIIDPVTNKTFKVPLFYLVDAMMRNSGNQYVTLFSSHIVVVFQRVFAEMTDVDKARLDFLLSTWEARKQLSDQILMEMRNVIGTRIVSTNGIRRLTVRETPTVRPEWHTEREPTFRPPPDRTVDYFSERRDPPNTLGLGPASVGIIEKPVLYTSIELRKELEQELEEMYNLMNAQVRYTVDQLKTINPQLLAQLEKATIEKLERKRKESRPMIPSLPHQLPLPHQAVKIEKGPLLSHDENNMSERFKNRMIGGFICEQPIVLDLGSAYDLTMKLKEWDPSRPSYAGTESLKEGSIYASNRLNDLLKNLDKPPTLPARISGNPPDDLLQQRIDEANKAQPKEKLPIPKFRHDLLTRPPKDALKALYVDRTFYCRQDGMRFKTQAELASHLDLLFTKNQDKQRKEGTRTYRQWYCKESQWVTDFGNLKPIDTEKNSNSTNNTTSNKNEKQVNDITDEEMVLPADEHFTRCPVSNEAFLPEWDTEEGDYMYRNAVKVLLTEKSDPELYKIAQPTEYSLIRYIIVHQKLVMDGWLAAGKSASLFDTINKINKKYGQDSEISKILIGAFIEAAGEEEDSNDIFILLESSERGHEPCISDTIYQYELSLNKSQQTQTQTQSLLQNQNHHQHQQQQQQSHYLQQHQNQPQLQYQQIKDEYQQDEIQFPTNQDQDEYQDYRNFSDFNETNQVPQFNQYNEKEIKQNDNNNNNNNISNNEYLTEDQSYAEMKMELQE